MADCIFCKIVKGEIPSRIAYKDDDVFAFEDINPKAPVHIVIVPRKHVERICDFKEKDKNLIGKLLLAAVRIGKEKKVEKAGYRLVINCNKNAGQEVFHIHVHLLGGRKLNWPPG